MPASWIENIATNMNKDIWKCGRYCLALTYRMGCPLQSILEELIICKCEKLRTERKVSCRVARQKQRMENSKILPKKFHFTTIVKIEIKHQRPLQIRQIQHFPEAETS
ncbi:hypothetical protein T05_13662 [Trichinella murrelli]|uniref:Uncharacterized protein n=1 Tax=Trichinella murrelli TaxID=144512 RepID=A0A0V0UA40_9BILA|nr:hypothetical protein T05_13662 [Trichinella murrelli]